jgi:hypothetical protein
MTMYERDPEEVGPESYADVELRMDMQDSIHEYDPDQSGRCQAMLIRHGAVSNRCNSTQRSSVMHANNDGCYRGCCASEEDHRERHNHGGGDCMCFEWED